MLLTNDRHLIQVGFYVFADVRCDPSGAGEKITIGEMMNPDEREIPFLCGAGPGSPDDPGVSQTFF